MFLAICVLWIFYEILEFQIVGWLVGSAHIHIGKGLRISPFKYFVLVTILYPVIEESIFRLPLRMKLSHVFTSLLVTLWFYSFRSEINQMSFGLKYPCRFLAVASIVPNCTALPYKEQGVSRIDFETPSQGQFALDMSDFYCLLHANALG